MDPITASYIRELLQYDPATGVFTRRHSVGRHGCHKAGEVVGSVDSAGYMVTTINNSRVYLHRIAVVYMTGEWPAEYVDHINGCRADNRWINLRQATPAINVQNRKLSRSDRKHGTRIGVKKHRRKWQARIRAAGKDYFLGSFETEELAHATYVAAKRQLHEGCTL